MKLKRLNRKGFTLIELLAVIVILAIVMGISATSILNSINNSRKSSLHSAAQTFASNINTWATEDALVQDNNSRKLGVTFETTYKDNKWHCLNGIQINNGGSPTSLINALGVAPKDIITGAGDNNKIPGKNNNGATNEPVTTNDDSASCSAIRYNSNAAAYEILLVAKTGGKYYVSGVKNYAFSRATSYATTISD